jgi:hypothetical protein
MAEFSVAALAFLGLMLGIVNFGAVLFQYDRVAGASKIGTRWAIVNTNVPPSNCATPGGTCQSAIISHILSYGGFDSSKLTTTITFGGTPAAPTSYACATQPTPGCWVNVSLKYKSTIGLLAFKAITLSSSSQMAIESQH